MAIAMTTKIDTQHWTTDQAAENLLDRLGVTWEYVPNIEIALVDRELSLQNQARLGVSLNADVVDEYALAMLDGAVFPALVAFPLANGTYLLAGGNHRLAAAREAKWKTVDLYLLRVNDEAMRRLITTSLNTLVGVRPQREETIEQAIAWMQRYGRSARIASGFYGVPEASLNAEMRRRSALKRIALAGVPTSSLPKSVVERIAQLQNDIVLREVAVLQNDCKLPETEVKRLVSEIKEQRTEAGQLAVVGQWRERDDLKLRRAEAHKGRPAPTVKNRAEVFRLLKSATNLLTKHTSLGQLGMSDADLTDALGLARSMVARLEEIGATPR